MSNVASAGRLAGVFRRQSHFGLRDVLLGALLVALWPVWRWIVLRTGDGSDANWGLLAAASTLALLVRDRHCRPVKVDMTLPIYRR